jgi:hypothetical protein
MSRFAARRALRRAGVAVDLYIFEQAGEENSRGQPWAQTAESPRTVDAIPDPGGKSVSYGTFGVEVDADQVYLVDADLLEEGLRDGGGEGASVIVQFGKAYRVIEADRTQNHGFAVLECDLDTEVDLP